MRIEPFVFMQNETCSDDGRTDGLECRLFCLITDKLYDISVEAARHINVGCKASKRFVDRDEGPPD